MLLGHAESSNLYIIGQPHVSPTIMVETLIFHNVSRVESTILSD